MSRLLGNNNTKPGLLAPVLILLVASGLSGCFHDDDDNDTGTDPTYTVTVTAGEGGSISPVSRSVAGGMTTTFTVTPEAGYAIESVTGCGGTLIGATYTTGVITADCVVTASFTASTLSTVSIGDTSAMEGNTDSVTLAFTVNLSAPAAGDLTVDYATGGGVATGGASCGEGIDYVAAASTLTIPDGASSGAIPIEVCGDTEFEPPESFTVTLSNVSANGTLGAATATGAILNDDPGGLNDTGITACGDYAWDKEDPIHDNRLDCAAVGATATADGTDEDGDPVNGGQDAHFGRDANPLTNGDEDGRAGFSFIKIGAGGTPLAIQGGTWSEGGNEAAGTHWSCVVDQVTGLMWEVKTDDGGLHDRDWRYSWYNTDGATNGGFAGESDGTDECHNATRCDTAKFVADVNSEGLCGHSDWRMPTVTELLSLVDNSVSYPGPMIDTRFFPVSGQNFWSATSMASNNLLAWDVSFANGATGTRFKDQVIIHIRLVRNAPEQF